MVDIGGGRELYLDCRGSGSPIVVLISGSLASAQLWTYVATDQSAPSPDAVLPSVAKFTRVCAYDRPGTGRADGSISPSSPVKQPTTADDGVRDLEALLRAAGEKPPYVLAAHSWGAMIATLFAQTHPQQVKGLVSVDGSSIFLPDALTSQQWSAFLELAKSLIPSGKEVPDYPTSNKQIKAAPKVAADIQAVVLRSDKPWQLLSTYPAAKTFPRWVVAQNHLARWLDAEYITKTNATHGLPLENPPVVVAAIRTAIDGG